MKKLSQIPAPAIAGVVREKTVFAAFAEIKNCYYSGADMIDLHLSTLEETDVESLRRIMNFSQLPVLALNYNTDYDRKRLGQTEEERVESFLRAVEAGAAGIDMQGYTFHAPSEKGFCGNPKEIVTDSAIIDKQCQLIETVHSMGAEVLLSCHPGIPMTTKQVVELAKYLEERNPDIIKIVTKAETQQDADEAIRTMLALKEEIKTPVAYHANGKAGMRTRIINPLLGGQIAFCVDRYTEASTMEQLHLQTVRSIVDNMKKF